MLRKKLSLGQAIKRNPTVGMRCYVMRDIPPPQHKHKDSMGGLRVLDTVEEINPGNYQLLMILTKIFALLWTISLYIKTKNDE